MSKKSKKRKNISKKVINDVVELKEAREGGQVALRGFSYQCLYSCYLILSDVSQNVSFQLEGIEDIDRIECKTGTEAFIHVQLKYSENRQNASFLDDVLKNFLEVYLMDQNRAFKLVYDFDVANGNMSKLFQGKLDNASISFWKNKIQEIRKDRAGWNWDKYDFESFIAKISFERIEKQTLELEIEKLLIGKYNVTTDNIKLFANGLKVLCLGSMERGSYITQNDLEHCIQEICFDISKGYQNPAHSWIRKLEFNTPHAYDSCGFFEGKKATPADIASGVPVRRPELEKEIIESIYKNTITVIKASSGQGKTTLALQSVYALQKEYMPYQVMWCDDTREIGNMVQFFRARVRCGEKILIVIDNLDRQFSAWDKFAQVLQNELPCNYKILVTTRESDWYNYSGDLSKVQSINIIEPALEEKEALQIFTMFKKENRLHPDMTDWRKAWNKIADRQLLIEYVYLITHGEMLAERISEQMKEIGKSSSGNVKCEILRRVCFADLCGVRLSVAALWNSLRDKTQEDLGEILKGMESEFLVRVNNDMGCIEGLHPVRSEHIFNVLHEFSPIEETAHEVIKMAQSVDLASIFSNIVRFTVDKNSFCKRSVEILWNKTGLSDCILAIKGLFSGSVLQYYFKNKDLFDTANSTGGLFIFLTEICPFGKIEEFDISVDTLESIKNIMPKNKGVEFLIGLKDKIPEYNLQNTYLYFFCEYLYEKLREVKFADIRDYEAYAEITKWSYHIDHAFNLSPYYQLEEVWSKAPQLSLECVSELMYSAYCGNHYAYINYINGNLAEILRYLKQRTGSQKIYVEDERDAIHVEYLLKLEDVNRANEESVLRLKSVCKMLPVFTLYCADGLKPSINGLDMYKIPDDAHKEMPRRNLVIMFNQDFNSLWLKTIMSNYEFDTEAEWLEYWTDIRKDICLLAEKCCSCMCKCISGDVLGKAGREFLLKAEELRKKTTGEKRYPKEDRPFEKKAEVPVGLSKIRQDYFQSMINFFNQFVGFLSRDEEKQRLALFNLKTARYWITTMQQYFSKVVTGTAKNNMREQLQTLEALETKSIDLLLMCCCYYQSHSVNKYFSKYMVGEWYEDHCRNERLEAEEKLKPLKQIHDVQFPLGIYNQKALSYYPVAVEKMDNCDEQELVEILEACFDFFETKYDYLVIVFVNSAGDVQPAAIQIFRNNIPDIRSLLYGETEKENQRALFYPVKISSNMLDCFANKYGYVKPSIPNISYDMILEGLWRYSATRELLTEEEDAAYRRSQLEAEEKEILNMIEELENEVPGGSDEKMSVLHELSDCVFAGEKFDNNLFNKFYEYFCGIE